MRMIRGTSALRREGIRPWPIMLKILPNAFEHCSNNLPIMLNIMLVLFQTNFIVLKSIDCSTRVYSGLVMHVTNYSFTGDCSIRVFL